MRQSKTVPGFYTSCTSDLEVLGRLAAGKGGLFWGLRDRWDQRAEQIKEGGQAAPPGTFRQALRV